MQFRVGKKKDIPEIIALQARWNINDRVWLQARKIDCGTEKQKEVKPRLLQEAAQLFHTEFSSPAAPRSAGLQPWHNPPWIL